MTERVNGRDVVLGSAHAVMAEIECDAEVRRIECIAEPSEKAIAHAHCERMGLDQHAHTTRLRLSEKLLKKFDKARQKIGKPVGLGGSFGGGAFPDEQIFRAERQGRFQISAQSGECPFGIGEGLEIFFPYSIEAAHGDAERLRMLHD